jgi:tetratricopeptide (TPR) repeat protein
MSKSIIAAQTAKEALKLSPKVGLQPHRILAKHLQRGIWLLEEKEQEKLLTEALSHARIVVSQSKAPATDDLYQLAMILSQLPNQQGEAYSYFDRALAAARREKIADLRPYFRGLFRTSQTPSTAVSWFKAILDNGGAEDFDWNNLAERLLAEAEYQKAGDAWLRAAELRADSEYLCQAGRSYWLADQLDSALSSYRRCIEQSVSEENSETRLANAYSVMSAILFERGVYDQAISYAKQSLSLSPGSAWAYHYLSQALNAAGRQTEAVSAAESAIRLSDGKFATMHFALGSANFDLENWERAAQAFQKAAELDPQSWEAAYNLALSLNRQHFYLDAARWYEEVLRRNPSHPEKTEILRRIQLLRK